jgi:signal transduction histidine kinase
MTTSTWDKIEIQKQFDGCRNLQDVIARLEADFSTRGEVICEIRVNGLVLHESDESKYSQSQMEEISTLAIASERPDDLIRDALVSALDYLSRVRKACETVSELFRGTDIHKAQTRFAEVIDTCQWMVDTITSLRGAAEGTGNPITVKDRWVDAENRFSEVVTDILGAYQKHDHVLTADLLEYELNNVLEYWTSVLTSEAAARAGERGI